MEGSTLLRSADFFSYFPFRRGGIKGGVIPVCWAYLPSFPNSADFILPLPVDAGEINQPPPEFLSSRLFAKKFCPPRRRGRCFILSSRIYFLLTRVKRVCRQNIFCPPPSARSRFGSLSENKYNAKLVSP